MQPLASGLNLLLASSLNCVSCCVIGWSCCRWHPNRGMVQPPPHSERWKRGGGGTTVWWCIIRKMQRQRRRRHASTTHTGLQSLIRRGAQMHVSGDRADRYFGARIPSYFTHHEFGTTTRPRCGATCGGFVCTPTLGRSGPTAPPITTIHFNAPTRRFGARVAAGATGAPSCRATRWRGGHQAAAAARRPSDCALPAPPRAWHA